MVKSALCRIIDDYTVQGLQDLAHIFLLWKSRDAAGGKHQTPLADAREVIHYVVNIVSLRPSRYMPLVYVLRISPMILCQQESIEEERT